MSDHPLKNLSNQMMRLIINQDKADGYHDRAAQNQDLYDRANCLGDYEGSALPLNERVNGLIVKNPEYLPPLGEENPHLDRSSL